MRTIFALSLVATAAMVWSLLAAAANRDPLILKVWPQIAFAPAGLHVELRIPRHPDNRIVHLVADGENFYRESDWQLDGSDAPFLFVVDWRDLPAGDYTIIAELDGISGLRGRVETAVQRVGEQPPVDILN